MLAEAAEEELPALAQSRPALRPPGPELGDVGGEVGREVGVGGGAPEGAGAAVEGEKGGTFEGFEEGLEVEERGWGRHCCFGSKV